MERKTVGGFVTKTRPEGIAEIIFSVFGILDTGNDITHPGSMIDTFKRHRKRIKLLDNHRADSVLAILGKILGLRELTRAQLPGELQAAYPEASGGAWAKVQYLMNTPEGEGAFARLKAGVTSWSWGYDTIKSDYSTARRKDGSKVTARNLRQVDLWELSQVLFPMLDAVTTVSAKSHQPDQRAELRRLEADIERLAYGGKSRHELLAEIYKAEVELSLLSS
jgi:hypothetical protein